MTSTRSDPVTLEIIQSSLQAIGDEMFAALRKTAMSAIIYEVLDMGTGITDGKGNLASSGAGIPAFVGVLDKAVMRIIELNDLGDIRPGDIFVTNDPYYGGVTHLNDVVLAMPVFAGGELVAWTANIAHWNDVGGMVPGSISNEAKEIFQEGLLLPPVKIKRRGEDVEDVWKIVLSNHRTPRVTFGDFRAMIGSLDLAEARLHALIRQSGLPFLQDAAAELQAIAERRMRAEIEKIPADVKLSGTKAFLCGQVRMIKLRMARARNGVASVIWEYPDELAAFLRLPSTPQHLRETIAGGHLVATEQPAFTAKRVSE